MSNTDPNDGITDKQQYDAAVRDLAQFPHGIDPITAWMSGSMWARTRFEAQDPTDAEVEAACQGFYDDPTGLTDWTKLARVDPALADMYRTRMRRALSAARAARRDEEKR